MMPVTSYCKSGATFTEEQMKAMAQYVAGLVETGVTFEVTSNEAGTWEVLTTGGY